MMYRAMDVPGHDGLDLAMMDWTWPDLTGLDWPDLTGPGLT